MPSSQGDSRSEDALCYKLDGLRSHDCERGQAPASVMSAAPMAHYLAAIDSGVSHHVSSLFRKASRQTERRTPMAYTGMKIPMPKATSPCVTLQELRPFSEDWGCPFYGVLLSLSVFPGLRRGERARAGDCPVGHALRQVGSLDGTYLHQVQPEPDGVLASGSGGPAVSEDQHEVEGLSGFRLLVRCEFSRSPGFGLEVNEVFGSLQVKADSRICC